MKITAFNPLIIAQEADAIVELFETLGFERRHMKTGINDEDITSIDMKDANGFRMDVTKVENMPRAMTTIRMTVDDFEEAYEFLKARGFINPQGDELTHTGTSKAAMLIAPSGFAISLTQHIKKDK